MSNFRKHLFLIEDDDSHAEIFEYYASKLIENLKITRMRDGEEVIEFLRKDPLPLADLPGLILLDLKLPKYSGHEVLKQIKAHPVFRRIPTIILSSSDREQDVRLAYENHANSYFLKPDKADIFDSTVEKIISYWQDNIQDETIYKAS